MGGRGEEKKGYAPPESMKKSSNTLTPAPLDAAVSVGLFFFLFFYCLSRNALLPGSWFYTPWAFCFLLLLFKKKGRTRREVFKNPKSRAEKKATLLQSR